MYAYATWLKLSKYKRVYLSIYLKTNPSKTTIRLFVNIHSQLTKLQLTRKYYKYDYGIFLGFLSWFDKGLSFYFF